MKHDEDEWVPRISCQGCGHDWPMWTLPHQDCEKSWERGSPSSHGIAGAPGRLTHVSETLDPRQIDAFSTPDDGSNTFRGHLQGISSRLNEGLEVGYILTVYFDFVTASRLKENLCFNRGAFATDGIEFSRMIVTLEPRST